MNNFPNQNQNALLLVMSDALMAETEKLCAPFAESENVEILRASTGLAGILTYNRKLPCLVLVEDSLPDIMGSSFCAILKDAPNGGDNVQIFLIGAPSNYFPNTKADYFFQKPLQIHTIEMVLQEFFLRRKIQLSAFLSDVENAKRKQKELIPDKLETSKYCVTNVFSAFKELSGDGLDYWAGDDDEGLYGFLFDCTGHDLTAFSQTSSIRAILKLAFRLYQAGMLSSLGKMLHDLNNDLFTAYNDDPTPAAAVLFHIRFDTDELLYCSAGMPNFFIQYSGEESYTSIEMCNPLIGAEKDAQYEDRKLSLENVERLLFATDGLSDLLFQPSPPLNMAKHDDVSGIVVEIKRA